MKTNQPGLEQPAVLPWHRTAADEINRALLRQNPTVAAIIASRDPHATTLRLLGRVDEVLADVSLYPKAGPYPDGPCLERGTHGDVCELLKEIRAHLAAMKGSK